MILLLDVDDDIIVSVGPLAAQPGSASPAVVLQVTIHFRMPLCHPLLSPLPPTP